MSKLSLLTLMAFSFSAHAQTTTLSTSSSTAEGTSSSTVLSQEVQNKKFDENHEITDPKLKADGGSLSRYSLKFNLTYTGPTLNDLSEKDQPNPDGTLGTYETAIGGSVGARYRISPKSSVGLSTGLKLIHPFHGAERTDLSNPSLTYDYSWRVGAVQMKNAPGFVLRTVPNFTNVGQYGMLLDNYSVVYDLGASGFSVGSDMAVGLFLYNRDYQASDKKVGTYSLEMNPNLKYNVSDRLALVTSVNLAWWNPRYRDSRLDLINKTVSQKLGLGYALRRDVYLNPFVTFYPQHLEWSGVTMNFSSIFSVF